MKQSVLGGAFIVAGTAIGAGMIALPMLCGLVGFKMASLLLLGVWAIMTYTGLLILEVTLTLPLQQNSFSSMAAATAGPVAQSLAWLCVLCLLYTLTGAYISGDVSVMGQLFYRIFGFGLPTPLYSLFFTVALGAVVWFGTRAVDLCVRLFLSTKGLALLVSIVSLLTAIHKTNLLAGPLHHAHTIALLPILLTAFGYHTAIPSITNYIGRDAKQVRLAIVMGATLPFILYLLWLLVTLGVIPQQGEMSYFSLQEGGNISDFVRLLVLFSNSDWVSYGANVFVNTTIVTSFLGVTLGLFDFLADALRRQDDRRGRTQTIMITLLPPLLFSICYPNSLVSALGFAAIFVALLEVILPVWMVWSLRRQGNSAVLYRVAGGKVTLLLVLLAGIVFILAALLGLMV